MKETFEDATKLEKERRLKRRRELANELSEAREIFVFTGLKEGALKTLRENDLLAPVGYVTPIDNLLIILQNEGFRVEGGLQSVEPEKKPSIITIAPAVTEGGFYGENLLHIKNLLITSEMDPRLQELINLAQE